MKKVALYPFNKIARGILRFKKNLSFEIANVIDFTNSVGADALEEVKGEKSGIEVVDALSKVLDDIDTLILTDTLEDGLIKRRVENFFKVNRIEERWKAMLLSAKDKGIRIVSVHPMSFFSDDINKWISENGIKVDTYEITREMFKTYIKKSNEIKSNNDIELVSVFATRGCLGKFTTQMTLREKLIDAGVDVATIITEPTHFIFDEYNGYYLKLLSEIKEDDSEVRDYFASHIENAKKDKKEMMLIAAQGSLCKYGKISDWALTVYKDFFDKSKLLLVVDYADDEQIEEALKALKEQAGQKPFALLIPDKIENAYGEYDIKTQDEIDIRKKELKERFDIAHVELIKDVENIRDILVADRK